MPYTLFVFIAIAVAFRLAALAISIRNEKRMLQSDAIEHHAATSLILTIAHIGFYVAAIAEGLWRDSPISAISVVGLILYGLAMCALVWVICTLGRFWTIKVIIAKDHQLISNRIFDRIRHPNYYLNIIPELIGFTLALQAFGVLLFGLPLYVAVLSLRIRQEEKVMRSHFHKYGSVGRSLGAS
ncbi:isoprenylcysteine carboxylmethyltransferase family protein [uncultured Roseobacter sp.]|uniref:isoprenylcysteine carboxylmethyltransferase family protein n=1 Tax=uncultured Roseobacter sp. TaxID=114847 RepID=UPI00260C65EE|nr:isoprenylcysteine carboxylmethyltransferase family protein [uncultured Roseobacter sp.]